MVPQLYNAYGLNLLSQLELGLPRTEAEVVEMRLELGGAVASTDDLPPGRYLAGTAADGNFLTAFVEDDAGYWLRARSIADVRVSSHLDVITCCPDQGTGPAHIRDLATTIFSFILPLKGVPAVHGAAVTSVPGLEDLDGAVALIGGSGAGKSTLAGHFCAAGARFLTDDLLALESAGASVRVKGGCTELRVRPAAADLLRQLADRPSRATVDQRTAVQLEDRQHFPIPLQLVVLPQLVASVDEVGAVPLSPSAALPRLLGMGRSGAWTLTEVQSAYFSMLAQVANSIPVVELKWSPLGVDLPMLIGSVRQVL